MKIDYKNYETFIEESFKVLTNKIQLPNNKDSLTADCFNDVFKSDEAAEAKNIIYIWHAKNKIPRLKGESDIIYIGQTSQTLRKRHAPSSKLKALSKANRQKYKDILELYGGEITVSYISKDNFDPTGKLSLLKIEGQFLWWYFQNHSEYPPVNYTKTKVRNDVYEHNDKDF